MYSSFDLLNTVLVEIENKIKTELNDFRLAKIVSISAVHLRRLFKFAFNIPIYRYIRARKLAVSLSDLLRYDFKVLDVALEYGFNYEQSYIRAFKREFGITPGEVRDTGCILKITPPLQILDKNKTGDNLIFGPDIVMVPKFYLVGKPHTIKWSESVSKAAEVGKNFWLHDRSTISNSINNDIYFGFTRIIDNSKSIYLPSLKVKNLDEIPKGFKAETFPSSMCARFRYIGQHHYLDMSQITAAEMYEAINKYIDDNKTMYDLYDHNVYFEKIDASVYDGVFSTMEWYSPIIKKGSKVLIRTY